MNVSEMLSNALGKSFVIRLNDTPKVVAEDAQAAIASKLIYRFSSDIPKLWQDGYWREVWAEVGAELVTNQGKIARRIAAYFYKRHGVKLLDADLSSIGNIASQGSTISGNYHVVFVCRRADLWEPGDYGDFGSCYFGDRRIAPGAIFDAGGAGITVHDSDNDAIGRAWVVCPKSSKPYVALFNWYNRSGLNWRLSSLAYLLASGDGSPFHGLKSAPSNLNNEVNDYGNRVYINGDRGMILHTPDYAPNADRCLELYVACEGGSECAVCGRHIGEDDTYHFDGNDYCGECNPAEECIGCGGEYRQDNMHWVEGHVTRWARNGTEGYLCDCCHSDTYNTCESCGDTVHTDATYTLERAGYYGSIEHNYCADCYPGHECEDCNTDFHVDDLNHVGDRGNRVVCDSCLSDNYTECADCHEQHANGDIIVRTVDGADNDYCESCAENHACAECANGSPDVWIGGDRYVCRDCYQADPTLVDNSAQSYQLSLVVEV